MGFNLTFLGFLRKISGHNKKSVRIESNLIFNDNTISLFTAFSRLQCSHLIQAHVWSSEVIVESKLSGNVSRGSNETKERDR